VRSDCQSKVVHKPPLAQFKIGSAFWKVEIYVI